MRTGILQKELQDAQTRLASAADPKPKCARKVMWML